MPKQSAERRTFLKQAASLSLLYPLQQSFDSNTKESKQHIVCVGAHPDDPESGCGGTLLLYALAGYQVSIVYLTKGEAGVMGKSHEEAARIRTKEAEAACKIIGAQPYFFGQIDGAAIFNQQAIKDMHQLLQKLKPTLLLTHWPIDTHPDHQVASLLSYQSWLQMEKSFPIYYFEVNSGFQTMQFNATDYIDITTVATRKKEALYKHTSQDPDDIYLNHHFIMQQFRGREIGVKEAEAFVRLDAAAQKSNGLPQ